MLLHLLTLFSLVKVFSAIPVEEDCVNLCKGCECQDKEFGRFWRYMVEGNKTYPNILEFVIRKDIFSRSKNYIQKHNSDLDNGFCLTFDKFSDRFCDEVDYGTGQKTKVIIPNTHHDDCFVNFICSATTKDGKPVYPCMEGFLCAYKKFFDWY